MHFLTNLNLVVPVVAALTVIIIAIIVICVLKGRQNSITKGTIDSVDRFCFYFRHTGAANRRWRRAERRQQAGRLRPAILARPQHYCAGQRDRDRHLRRYPRGVRGNVAPQASTTHESRFGFALGLLLLGNQTYFF